MKWVRFVKKALPFNRRCLFSFMREKKAIYLTHAAHRERDSRQGSKCTVPGRTRTVVGGGKMLGNMLGKMLGTRLTGARQQARAQRERSRTEYNLLT